MGQRDFCEDFDATLVVDTLYGILNQSFLYFCNLERIIDNFVVKNILLFLPSSLRTPQCPLSVKPHKQTSVMTNKLGKADLMDLTAFWVGPVGEKASSPFGDLYFGSERTPKTRIVFKPFWTNGPRNLQFVKRF
jgi:hypothetical protein